MAAEGNSQSGKKGRRKVAEIEELLEDVARLQLVGQAQTRDLWGTLVTTVIMKTEAGPVRRMQAAGQAYHDACLGKTPAEHEKGPPCIHVALALFSSLEGESQVTEATKKILGEMKEKYLCRPTEEAVLFARMCKLGKCWQKDMTKVHYHFLDPDATHAVTRALKQLGGDVKHGRPPPGGLETKIRKNLDRHG